MGTGAPRRKAMAIKFVPGRGAIGATKEDRPVPPRAVVKKLRGKIAAIPPAKPKKRKKGKGKCG